MAARSNSQGSTFFLLALLATVVMAGALYLVLSSGSQEIAQNAEQLTTAQADLLLASGSKPPPASEPVPPWLVLLVAVVSLSQIFSLMIAERISRETLLTRRMIRKIEFLCETPMYLGLLGSLLGICATQWTTGSLAAPLAYLTTITGIVFHLFGKFTIVLSLPEVSGDHLSAAED